MTKFLMITAAALALAGPAFAKAHDQGVADGEEPAFGPGEAAGAVDNVVRDGGRDASGALAAERRAAKGDNGVKPVVGNGANSK